MNDEPSLDALILQWQETLGGPASLDPGRQARECTRLLENADHLLARPDYLAALKNVAGALFGFLNDRGVGLSAKLDAVRAVRHVYAAAASQPVAEDYPIAYFWGSALGPDSDLAIEAREDDDAAELCDAIWEVLVEALQMHDPLCQSSALTGIECLGHPYSRQVLDSMEGRWLDDETRVEASYVRAKLRRRGV